MSGHGAGPTVLLASHDGDGLGHARRNARLAAALLRRCPEARIVLVTGIASRHDWLEDPRVRVVRTPAITKRADGTRTSLDGRPLAEVIADREVRFTRLVDTVRPDLVVVDRHPVGVDGEWRAGLDVVRRSGGAVMLGLRDVLDVPERIRAEVAGPGWADAARLLDVVAVYGHRRLCDHEAEYALPLTPQYCGIVVDRPSGRTPRSRGLLAMAGGGRDGHDVTRLALAVGRTRPVTVVTGPQSAPLPQQPGVRVLRQDPIAAPGPAGTLQMAGYNSTWETIAAGVRPLLLPRRAPRREQALRAGRLAALDLADVIDESAGVEEIEWLLARPRSLAPTALERAGIGLDGASRATALMLELLGTRRGVVA